MSILRFWRRFKIIPGIKVNAHKSGLSVSLGPQGSQLTLGGDGVRVTGGIEGTGLFLTKKLTRKVVKSTKKIVCSNNKDHKTLIEFLSAVDYLEVGDLDAVTYILTHRRFKKNADVQNLLGWIYIETGEYKKAMDQFQKAAVMHDELGEFFGRLKVKITFNIPLRIGSEINIDLWNPGDAEQPMISSAYVCLLDGNDEETVKDYLQKFHQKNNSLKCLILAMDIAIANDLHKDPEQAQGMLNTMAGIESDFFITLYRAIVAIEQKKKQAATDFLSDLIKKRSAPLELRMRARLLRADIYNDCDKEHLANKDREWVEAMGGKCDD